MLASALGSETNQAECDALDNWDTPGGACYRWATSSAADQN